MNIADIAAIVNAGGGGGGGETGGGFDFVIKCDNTTSELIYGLDSGDFDKVVEIIQNHACLTAYCYSYSTVLNNVSHNLIFRGAYYNDDDDMIETTWYNPNSSMSSVYLMWQRDGTVYED